MNVGAAEIDITPDFSVDLAGFASRAHPSVGVLDPIHARAIYLDDAASGGAGEKLLWIASDVIAMAGEFVADFRKWARQALGLEARQVLLSATHTHSAPATIDLNGAGRFSARYAMLLRSKLEEVARTAMAKTEPARIVAASAPLDLAVHRTGPASRHSDPVVWSIGFARPDGSYVAAIVNYAMHPVTLGPNEERVSPDWCGAAATSMHAALRGKPITLVTNGAAGNLNPPTVGIPPLEVARLGRTIGHAAADALRAEETAGTASPSSATTPDADALRVRSVSVQMPLDWLDAAAIQKQVHETIASIKAGWEWETVFQYAVAAWGGEMTRRVQAGGGREQPIEIQAIKLGDVTIVAVNGEPFSRFTDILRSRTGNRRLFVVGYANSAFGYIPSREAYADKEYETEQAHFFYNSFRPKEGSLEMLADRAAELVGELSRS